MHKRPTLEFVKTQLLAIASNNKTDAIELENLVFFLGTEQRESTFILRAVARNPNTPVFLLRKLLIRGFVNDIAKNPVMDLYCISAPEMSEIFSGYENKILELKLIPDWVYCYLSIASDEFVKYVIYHPSLDYATKEKIAFSKSMIPRVGQEVYCSHLQATTKLGAIDKVISKAGIVRVKDIKLELLSVLGTHGRVFATVSDTSAWFYISFVSNSMGNYWERSIIFVDKGTEFFFAREFNQDYSFYSPFEKTHLCCLLGEKRETENEVDDDIPF